MQYAALIFFDWALIHFHDEGEGSPPAAKLGQSQLADEVDISHFFTPNSLIQSIGNEGPKMLQKTYKESRVAKTKVLKEHNFDNQSIDT